MRKNSTKQKIPIIPYDIAAAEWFARERARLTAIGKTPAYADGQIAAIAQVNDLTLVTNNVESSSNISNITHFSIHSHSRAWSYQLTLNIFKIH